jgi:hypothetical protein
MHIEARKHARVGTNPPQRLPSCFGVFFGEEAFVVGYVFGTQNTSSDTEFFGLLQNV